jgi:hypothetical protein
VICHLSEVAVIGEVEHLSSVGLGAHLQAVVVHLDDRGFSTETM